MTRTDDLKCKVIEKLLLIKISDKKVQDKIESIISNKERPPIDRDYRNGRQEERERKARSKRGSSYEKALKQ